MNRTSPVELRKALELANLLVEFGIDFVCIPVISQEDKIALVAKSMRRFEKLEQEAA